MEGRNFLETLLDGATVEWKALGEIGNFIRGSGIQKSDFTESGVGCIHYGQIHTHYGTWAVKTKSFINPEFAARLRKAHLNDLVIATTSEDDAAVAKAVAWLGDEDVAVSTDAYIYRHAANPKYMSYFFQTECFQSQKKSRITGTKVRRISGDSLAKIKIPIPPPYVQAEIVRILDTFTDLTRELTRELTDRKKQYHYYRDRLLTFEKGEVEWKTLGEVAEYANTRISFDRLNETNYVGVDNLLQNRAGKTISNYVPTSGNLTEYREGDILIGNIRPYLKKIWQADRIGGTNGDVLVIRLTNNIVNARYLYQVLADERFFEYNIQHAKGAKMPRGNKDKILEYQFSVPPLAEQARIVAILDKFDTLTTSINEGLPREIALRQQQYEYYRDLLFNFPPPLTSP